MPSIVVGALVVEIPGGLVCLGRGLSHLAQTIADEQQIFRINVARLDKASSLLGASARVRLIYHS
jgi:hypothetical protein